MTFEELNVDSSICKALSAIGFEYPMPVQEKVIPKMMDKADLIVKSKTGSGKTASFAIPIIQSLIIDEKLPQALILCPTRELARQIKEEFDTLGVYKKIKTLLITGKQPFRFQKEDLQQRCHVVIGTPGRILDHLEQGNLIPSKIKFVVMDEADEMLNLNFIEDIQSIYQYLDDDKTSCIFSATYPDWIQSLSVKFLKSPELVEIQSEQNQIEERFYKCMDENKNLFLLKALGKEKPESCIVFCKTQAKVDEVYTYLYDKGISCDRIHGSMMQEERFACMKKFKEAKIRILIATDVAARGIDVEKVELVINYDMPSPCELYVHRIGRSARVNEKGLAISFINEFDDIRTEKLEEFLNHKIDCADASVIESYVISDDDLEALSKSVRVFEDKTKELKKDIIKLYINGGKNKKIRPGDIVGAICRIDGLVVDDIGPIQVQDHQSYVDIMNGKGLIVLNQLKTIKGKSVKVQKAK